MPVDWDAGSACFSGKESEPPTTRWVKATAHCWDFQVWQSDGRKDALDLARSTPKYEYRAAVSWAHGEGQAQLPAPQNALPGLVSRSCGPSPAPQDRWL